MVMGRGAAAGCCARAPTAARQRNTRTRKRTRFMNESSKEIMNRKKPRGVYHRKTRARSGREREWPCASKRTPREKFSIRFIFFLRADADLVFFRCELAPPPRGEQTALEEDDRK